MGYDGREGGRVTVAGLEQDVIYSIGGRTDELWLGRRKGGLTVLRPKAGSFAATSFTRADGLAQDSVYSVYPARDGTVWAGTLSAGVSALRDGHFTNYAMADGLASDTVAAILETADGTLWFATPRGLSSLANGRWRTYTNKNGLRSDNVNCLWRILTGSFGRGRLPASHSGAARALNRVLKGRQHWRNRCSGSLKIDMAGSGLPVEPRPGVNRDALARGTGRRRSP